MSGDASPRRTGLIGFRRPVGGRNRVLGPLVGAALELAAGVAPAQSPQPAVADIKAYLIYESSGTLSDNIAPPVKFHGWNTLIGEGDARQPANDVLVMAVVSGPRGSLVPGPLSLTISDRRTKRILVSRTIDNLLFGANGEVTKGVFVPDATCTPLEIEASIGASRRSTTLDFACAE